jgi:uncharacterized alpha-E superfamily protein
MLSRVADSIYWMSRCVERAENVARFIDVNLTLTLDSPASFEQQWQPLINTTGDEELFAKRFGEATPQNTVYFLAFDLENPNSILSCIRGARENARSIREVISSEMWEELNTFYLAVKAEAERPDVAELPHQFFAEVKRSSHLFNGVTDATMSRTEGWHFLEMGRMLERADKTSRILDVKYYILLRSLSEVGTPVDDLQWAAVLRSASAFEMYRKRHGRITPNAIIDFLLLDPEFPRSVRYCLERARGSLHSITGTPIGSFRNLPEKLLGPLCSDLAFTNAEEINTVGLHQYLDDLQTRVNQVGAGIFETFFASKTPKVTRRPVHTRIAQEH